VGPVLFFLDQGMKSGMLRLEFLGHSLIHRRLSFLQKRVSPLRNKPRIDAFVLIELTVDRRRAASGRERGERLVMKFNEQ
jgi:hypothetical protein